MLVTAKLSRKFYETFGDEIADDLVGWFNAVDATYRTDLKEFNELNFARFDAKLDQRFAEFDAKVERRLAEFEAKMERRMTALEAKVENRLAHFETQLAETKSELIRWMFIFSAPTMLTVLGLGVAVTALLLRR